MVRDIDELGFNYKEEEEASGYTSELAANLQLYAHSELLRGPAVTTTHNTSLLLELLEQLTPRRLILLAADFEKNLTGAVRSEHWYGTEYAQLELGEGELEAWAAPPHNSMLAVTFMEQQSPPKQPWPGLSRWLSTLQSGHRTLLGAAGAP